MSISRTLDLQIMQSFGTFNFIVRLLNKTSTCTSGYCFTQELHKTKSSTISLDLNNTSTNDLSKKV